MRPDPSKLCRHLLRRPAGIARWSHRRPAGPGVPLLSGGGQWFPAAVTRDSVAAALLPLSYGPQFPQLSSWPAFPAAI